MKEITVAPSLEAVAEVLAFAEEQLEADGCPPRIAMKMSIALDELFSNVVRYSGAARARVACGVDNGEAVLRIADDGLPYDPTAKEAPDVALSAGEREIGGLGIHIVRTFMDAFEYARSGEWNLLSIRKSV